MIIIPIGAQSSVALKPRVTISLIIINVIVFFVSIPISINSEREFLGVEAELQAKLIEMYNLEHGSNTYAENTRFNGENILFELSSSSSPGEFRQNYLRALSTFDITPAALSSYEKTLEGRKKEYYYSRDDELLQAYIDWKILKEREKKLVSGNINYAFGLIPASMNRLYTFITHMFLHGGLLHLIGNMIFLWVVGCVLEDSWGSLHFALFYLAGGAVAGLFHCLQDTHSTLPLIGASGAIAATMGAFALRHFMTRIKFFYFFLLFFRPFWGTFSLPAFIFLPFWLLEQVVMKHLSDGSGGSNIAYMAHIGGFTAGFLYALILGASGIEKKLIAPHVEKEQIKKGVSRDPRFIEACNLVKKGNTSRAKVIFSSLIREYPHDTEMIEDIAMIYRENGMTKEFETLIERNVKFLMLNGQYEEAASMILTFHVDAINIVRPQQIFKVAKWLSDRERYQDSYMLYRSIIDSGITEMNIVGKAYTEIITILVWKMSRVREALEMCEEWKELPSDRYWKDQVSMIEEKISEFVGMTSVDN